MAAKKKKGPTRRPANPKRATALPQRPHEQALQVLRKKFGSAVTTLQQEAESVAQITEFFSTGVDVLDHYVIGRGGMPAGRISETFGDEGCGKTALLYRLLAMNQRAGGLSFLADAEYSFDEERADVAGIDRGTLLLGHPAHLEQTIEMIKAVVSNHNPKLGPLLVGLDSIASINTKAGVSMAAGEAEVGAAARIWSDELRDLPRLLHKHRAHLFMTNQVRHKIGGASRFGPNIVTPGGNAPKFYSSVRLQFFGGKAIKNLKTGEHTGKVVTIMAVKNRLGAPFKKARVRFDYATGYNNQWSTIEHAKTMALINARGKDGKPVDPEKLHIRAMQKLGWEENMLIPTGQPGGEYETSDEQADDEDED